MKKILLLLCLIQTINVAAQEMVMDKIIAIVGNQAILLSDVEQQAAMLEKQQGVLPDGAKCSILDQLLVQSMLVVRAELDSIDLPDEQVEEQLDARIQQIMAYMDDDVEQFKDYYGKTPEEVKEDFRGDLRNQLLAQRMQQTVMQSVKITPSEVVTFFHQIPKDSLPYFNSEVEVGEISISPKANERSRKETRDTLNSVRERILSGAATFEVMAKKYSQDPGSARNGGDLGWAKRGKFVPEFEAIAYNLEPNEISEVFESDFGYHIMQLLERRGNTVHTRHVLIKPKVEMIDHERTIQLLDSLRHLIATDSISFEYAVSRHSDENTQSKTNAGLFLNPQTGDALFEIGDLPPEVYFTIDTMKVGQLSSPVLFENIQTGEVLYKVILLISRTEPHVANLQDDYYKIQKAALERKKMSHMEKWVKSQVGEIYIKVSEEYDSCPGTKTWNSGNNSN